MRNGSDDAPRRSRRTRTNDAPPADGRSANGGAATGTGDDVLDRYGLRDVDTPRDDARRGADDERPWPPRARRRGAAPDASESGRPDTDDRDGRRRDRNGRVPADPPAGTDRPPRDDRDRGPEPAATRDPVTERTDALPSVPVERASVPGEHRPVPGEGASGSGERRDVPAERPDVPPPPTSDRPGRRRRGAADSRHTQVMPVTPRRRAREDDPEPQVDEPATRERPVVPPRAAGPPSAPAMPAPPVRQDDGSRTPAQPDTGSRTPAHPDGAARPAAPPDGAPRPATAPTSGPGAAATPRVGGPPVPARDATPPPGDRQEPARSDQARSAPATAPAGPGDADHLDGPDDLDGTGDPDRANGPDDVAPIRERRASARTATRRRPGRRPSVDDGPPVEPTPPTPVDDDPPPPAGPGRRLFRVGVAVVAVLVFVACASGFTSRQTVENGIRTVAALDPQSDAISSRAVQAGDENVLVLGLPANRATTPEPARTDTAVLVHLPAGGAPAVTLGFPANLEVARPPCQRWDGATGTYGETVPAESRTALSSAYDVGGPKCAVGVAQQVTGLAVTRFIAFDMTGVNPIVDSVRGVGVCTERPVVDRALGPVVTRPGDTVLGGTEAERFAAASGVDDTSPIDRVRRQQRILSAVLEDALSTTSLLTPGASDRIARALPGALTVDGAEAGDLLVLSRSLSLTSGEDAAPPYVSVPVSELPNTRGHVELNRGDSSDLFTALQKHEPLPPEFAVPAQRGGTPLLPQGTVVDVRNAAGQTGLADAMATALRAQGYVIGAVGDAPAGPDSVIRFSPDRADAAKVLSGSVPGARPEPDPGATGTLQVVLGSSFRGVASMGAPAVQAGQAADCG